MNKICKLIAGIGVAALFTACADEDIAFVNVNRPGGLDTYTYLDQYDVLKSYVNKQKSPNFKLGVALSAADYNNRQTVFALANTNFDEIVAGNEMKFASCVDDKGVMDFGTVESFVDAAEEAGVTIYGHTLVWHSQQRPKWLNSIASASGGVAGGGSAVKEDPILVSYNFDDDKKFVGNGEGEYKYVAEGRDGSNCFKLDCTGFNSGNPWDAQLQVSADFKAGVKYAVEMDVKGTVDAGLGMSHEGIGNPNWGAGGYNVTTEWQTVTVVYSPSEDGGRFHFNLGGYAGTIWIDNFKVYNKDVYDKQQPVEKIDAEYKFDDDKQFVGNGADSYQLVAEGPDDSKCFKLDCTGFNSGNPWDAQLQVGAEYVTGTEYTISMKVKGTVDAGLGMSHEGIGNPNWGAGSYNVTTEWSDVSFKFKPAEDGGRFHFNLGAYAGTIWIDNFKISHMEEPSAAPAPAPSRPTEEVITVVEAASYDFENGVNFVGNGSDSYQIVAEGPEGSNCFKLDCTGFNSGNPWDAQLQVAYDYVTGTPYTISMKVKGTSDAGLGMSHEGISNPNWGAASYNVTTEWSDVSMKYTPAEDGGKFQFNLGGYAGTIWIDDFKITCETKEIVGGGPASPEAAKDTLTWALDRFIGGMMKATRGKVVAWDLANETVDGVDNDGDGIYDQRSLATAGDDDFIWQAYLGDVDFVVIAEKLARQHFAANGGKPEDMKLFINDFNLESWWDGNKKCASLIEWIKKWEAAGAKIDGIGTQMHVSYIANSDDQKAQEAAIVNMFKMMAATGKLVRVSELDMGYCEKAFADGKKTSELTFEQEKQMSDFYKFIVKAYLENVPAAQQYGITQWCITDAPDNSGWRGGEPVGLWTQGYERKPAYAGFADGLQGK
ncbi:MAG: endo-1,4-beta-xylanase [Bacteroidales bacterium]|nr:endo-1,4-beta-xylanase [Bacteroidales bacterium]